MQEIKQKRKEGVETERQRERDRQQTQTQRQIRSNKQARNGNIFQRIVDYEKIKYTRETNGIQPSI